MFRSRCHRGIKDWPKEVARYQGWSAGSFARKTCIEKGLYRKRPFSTTNQFRLMETAGFTENQMMVREAIVQVCQHFPNTYWQEHDQSEKDPTEFRRSILLSITL